MTCDEWDELYVTATRLQALRDISRLAAVGLDPDLQKIGAAAERGVARLEKKLKKLSDRLRTD
jgi:hypothetical protein